MQGLADGYFVLPYTIGGFLSTQDSLLQDNTVEFSDAVQNNQEKIDKLLSIKGSKTVDEIHKKLGR